jgi:hypothetical protein
VHGEQRSLLYVGLSLLQIRMASVCLGSRLNKDLCKPYWNRMLDMLIISRLRSKLAQYCMSGRRPRLLCEIPVSTTTRARMSYTSYGVVFVFPPTKGVQFYIMLYVMHAQRPDWSMGHIPAIPLDSCTWNIYSIVFLLVPA